MVLGVARGDALGTAALVTQLCLELEAALGLPVARCVDGSVPVDAARPILEVVTPDGRFRSAAALSLDEVRARFSLAAVHDGQGASPNGATRPSSEEVRSK